MIENFQSKHVFEKRKIESSNIRAKYPDRIPVIVEKAHKSDMNLIDKNKYLVPDSLTVGQFVYIIRRRLKLPPEKAIFIYVRQHIPPGTAMMSTVYEDYKDKDGFLYMTYTGENVFGK